MTHDGQSLTGRRNSRASLGLAILVAWAGLCALWNAYGAMQISMGGRALGPTATYAGAGLVIFIAIALLVTSSRWPLICRALAIVAGALAAWTIWNSFILDRNLWPSEFWRWAGIALNGSGILGAAMIAFSTRRDTHAGS